MLYNILFGVYDYAQTTFYNFISDNTNYYLKKIENKNQVNKNILYFYEYALFFFGGSTATSP